MKSLITLIYFHISLILCLFIFSVSLAETTDIATSSNKNDATQLKVYQLEFSKLDSTSRKTWIQLLAKANESALAPQPLEAINYIAQAEAIFASHPQLLTLKTLCYLQQKRLDLALLSAQKAYDLDSENYTSTHNLAEIHFDLNQWDKAKTHYTKILESNNSLFLQFALDIIEIKLGNIDLIKPKLATLSPLSSEPYYFFLNYVITAEENPNNIEIQSALIEQIKSIYQYNPNLLIPWFDKLNASGYGL